MANTPQYRKWVGILLGLLLHGSSHFLSGKRTAGLKWYFSILICSLLPIFISSMPGVVTYVIGIILSIIAITLWCVMLKQSYRPIPRIGFRGWLAVIVLVLVLNNSLTLCVRQFIRTFKVPSGAMSPTIMPGDHLCVERLSYRFGKPKRGEIIVFSTKGIKGIRSDTFYIKRVAGLPGERIRIEPPFLIVNDQKVDEPNIFNTISSKSNGYAGFQPAGQTDEIVLGPDEYFVLGDNTMNSLDSRYWGPVPKKNLLGRATRIYWPFDRINNSLGKE